MPETPFHTVVIAVHAGAGVVAFLTGCLAVRHPRVFPAYFAAMVVMVVSLVVVVIEEWARIDLGSRLVFSGLVLLAGFMMLQAERARRLDAADPDVAVARFQRIGFTLVGLAVAYLVIQVLGMGAPGWLAGVAALAASLGGHVVLVAIERRMGSSAATSV